MKAGSEAEILCRGGVLTVQKGYVRLQQLLGHNTRLCIDLVLPAVGVEDLQPLLSLQLLYGQRVCTALYFCPHYALRTVLKCTLAGSSDISLQLERWWASQVLLVYSARFSGTGRQIFEVVFS